MRYRIPFLLVLVLFTRATYGQTLPDSPDTNSIVTGSLSEVRNSRRVLLLVRRSRVVDSRGMAKTIVDEAYRADPDARTRYPWLFNLLARKLNNYIRQHQSMSAVKRISDAEFIVFFNLLEYRRPLGHPYPYGEMFVIKNSTVGGKPRIVWKTRKSSMWAEDAIEDLIKDLKAVRGEG